MIDIGDNLFYLILFVVGFLSTALLFLVKTRFFILNLFIDIIRTFVVGMVFLLLTHFAHGGKIEFSTILTYSIACVLALLMCENLPSRRKKALSKRVKTRHID